MPLRMLRYMCEIWESYTYQNPKAKKLPAILPIVFYHGKGHWKYSPDFEDLIDMPDSLKNELVRHIPQFTHALIQLEDVVYVDNIERESDLMLDLFKAINDGTFKKRFFVQLDFLKKRSILTKNLSMWIKYSIELGDINPDILIDEFKKMKDNEVKGEIMTVADRLIEKGKAEGIAGSIQILQNILGQSVDSTQELSSKSIDELKVQQDLLQTEISQKLS